MLLKDRTRRVVGVLGTAAPACSRPRELRIPKERRRNSTTGGGIKKERIIPYQSEALPKDARPLDLKLCG